MNILKELREAGYARLEFRRDPQGRLSGKFWRISDLPEFQPDQGQGGSSRLPRSGKKATKPVAGTDGLLSRPSEKPEDRKSSPLPNPDFRTEQLKKKENGGSVPPAPASSCSLLAHSPDEQPAEPGKSVCEKAGQAMTALAAAYQERTGMAYPAKRMQQDRKAAEECFSLGPAPGPKGMARLYNSAWFLTDGYRPVCKKEDGSPRFEPFFHCFKVRTNPGYLYDHWQQVLEELESEPACQRRRRLEAREGAAPYPTLWEPT